MVIRRFRLFDLPLELIYKIIGHATCPDDASTRTKPSSYKTARRLARSCTFLFRSTMPYLLRTIVLTSDRDLALFLASYRRQKEGRIASVRLAVNYQIHVRRVWFNNITDPTMALGASNVVDYKTLYEIIRESSSLAMNVFSMHIISSGLVSRVARPDIDWFCSHITFEGDCLRWNGLTSSHAGQIFLRKITHLCLWVPYHDLAEMVKVPVAHPSPTWIKNIPFRCMPNLRHLAFPLLVNNGNANSPRPSYKEMLIYTVPYGQSSTIVGQWASHPKFVDFGQRVQLRVIPRVDPRKTAWSVGNVLPETERVWSFFQ